MTQRFKDHTAKERDHTAKKKQDCNTAKGKDSRTARRQDRAARRKHKAVEQKESAGSDPDLRYHISASKNNPQDIFTLIRENHGDPAYHVRVLGLHSR